MLSKVIRDPLVHFLIVGVAVFILLSTISPAPAGKKILVDRAALLTFLQYRSKAFEAVTAQRMLDRMTPDARERLINDYIREEALFREAQALGLDEGDYVMRKRMIQKMEFITETMGISPPPHEDILREYYTQNQAAYGQPPGVTFTHVFISAKDRGLDDARMKASSLLVKLRRKGVVFSEAPGYGDRFLYHTNYVARRYDLVKSHFGATAANMVFSDEFPLLEWQGPFMLEHGAHLFFKTAHMSGGPLPFMAVRTRIIQDMERDYKRNSMSRLVGEIIGGYTVTIARDITEKPHQSSRNRD